MNQRKEHEMNNQKVKKIEEEISKKLKELYEINDNEPMKVAEYLDRTRSNWLFLIAASNCKKNGALSNILKKMKEVENKIIQDNPDRKLPTYDELLKEYNLHPERFEKMQEEQEGIINIRLFQRRY